MVLESSNLAYTLPISLVDKRTNKIAKQRLDIQVPSKETEVEMEEEKRKKIRRRRTRSNVDRFSQAGVLKTKVTLANSMRQQQQQQLFKSLYRCKTVAWSSFGCRKSAIVSGKTPSGRSSSVERQAANRWMTCSRWPIYSATLILLLLICNNNNNNQINCDQHHSINEREARKLLTTNQETSSLVTNQTVVSNDLIQSMSASNTSTTTINENQKGIIGQPLANNGSSLANDDYRQRPNPASSEQDTSTKRTYDMQHERILNAMMTTIQPPPLVEGGGVGALPPKQMAEATAETSEPTSLSANITNQVGLSGPAKVNVSLIELAIEKKPFAEVDIFGSEDQKIGLAEIEHQSGADLGQYDASPLHSASATGGQQPAAEFLVGVTGESASANGGASLSAASLDESAGVLDLDALSSTSSSVTISRHGRASSPSNSYTAPASSRLSAYTPMLLQNSRAHFRSQETGVGPGVGVGVGGGQASNQVVVDQQAADARQQQRLSSALSTTTRIPPSGPFDPIIVCYLGSWSVYRPSLAKFTPENINPFLCTHIIYAFAGLSSKFELRPFDSYNDITQGGYRKFTGLKEYNKQLKTLIAVGGWNEGSAR